MRYLVLIMFLQGCITPSKWSPDSHAEIMQNCKLMCGNKRAKSYTPVTGECVCIGRER